MHPFSPLFRKLQLSEEGLPPEDLLPLLADADLNHRAAAALHLQDQQAIADIPWTHKVNDLLGLYHQKSYLYNPDWKVPSFDDIHVREDLIDYLDKFFGPLLPGEKRKLKLTFPARFFPRKTKYLPLSKAIKKHYPEHLLGHFFKCVHHLWVLWEAGILYKREGTHLLSFQGLPYPWEQRHHGPQSVCPKSSGISPGASITMASNFPRRLGHVRGQKRSLASGSPSRGRGFWPRFGAPSWRSTGLVPNSNLRLSNQSTINQKQTVSTFKKGQSATSPSQCQTRYYQVKGQNEYHSSERKPRGSEAVCWWLSFFSTTACGDHCLSHFITNWDRAYWGPCTQHGSSSCWSPRTPRRVTGGIFLVDKNTRNRKDCRLVVDFSQFSRGPDRVRWPKFAVPNLQSLTNLLSSDLQWLSLDVSAAFYHIPLVPAASPHLLVGSPGLVGTLAGMSIHACSRGEDHQLQDLHHFCHRSTLETLMLLHNEYGRKLHLYSHPIIMGFRKIPMGVGLSPFLLAQFTSAICSVVRRTFKHCVAFAYMDDVVLGARTLSHLESIYSSCVNLLVSLGIKLNPEKTQWWGPSLHFMGLIINASGSMPQPQHVTKGLTMLKKLPINRPLDYKIMQRVTGLLGFLAPFTMFGYPLIKPMYTDSAFVLSALYKQCLIWAYSNLLPVARQRPGICVTYADATPSGWGWVSAYSFQVQAGSFATPLPIFVAETIAALLARLATGARILGVDNQAVASGKYTKLPWLLGCFATMILRGTSFIYVPSEANPADLPSRGLLPHRLRRLYLRFRPTTGRTSLYAPCLPVPPRTPDRVSFASPLQTYEGWQPP
uniref:Protein P n=3 Tax=Orthohepadnavirus TaxID=10405 RepID=U3M9Y0_9HEPA|nr:polymerase [Tent-making bat hepatitis B virus]